MEPNLIARRAFRAVDGIMTVVSAVAEHALICFEAVFGIMLVARVFYLPSSVLPIYPKVLTLFLLLVALTLARISFYVRNYFDSILEFLSFP